MHEFVTTFASAGAGHDVLVSAEALGTKLAQPVCSGEEKDCTPATE